MNTQVNDGNRLKYKSAFICFPNSWLLAAFTWPLFFVNITEEGWEYPLFVTEVLVMIDSDRF